MSRTANPVKVGAFVVGMLVLAFLLVLFFTGAHWFSKRIHYMLVYDTSIKGLTIGAPVTLKGVKIGEVTDIKARLYGKDLSVLTEITVEVDPELLESDFDTEARRPLTDELIKRGLSAQLRMQSLLTGLLYVDVDFRPDKERVTKNVPTQYQQLPTTPTDLERLTRDLESIDINKLGENLQQIVQGINNLVNDRELQKLMANANQTLESIRTSSDALRESINKVSAVIVPLAQHGDTTITEINRELPELISKLDATMGALQQTAASVQKVSANANYLSSEDSPLLYRIETATGSIDNAANNIRHLSDLLERQPESLLYGKQENGKQEK